MKKIIYVVEDEQPIRDLYKYAINPEEFDVVTFVDGESMFQSLKYQTPHLFILDIMLAGMSGMDILKKIKSIPECQNSLVIMVSAKNEEMTKVTCLNNGADDYMAKPFSVLELVARIKANLRKAVNVNSSNIQFKDIIIDDDKHIVSVSGEEQTLTIKEYNLIKLLVKNANKVIDRETFFMKVWGESFLGETRTLDIHIKEVRKKLINSEAQIETVRSVGYKLV